MAATTSSPPTRTLYITGIPKADALLNSNGTALLIGMLLDQQVPMEWAFTGPYTIKQRLGHCDASKIAPGYGEEKTEIFIALLGKTFGVRPSGWKKAAGVFSDAKPRSVADIYSQTSLLKVRGFKQMQRAQDVDKQDRPRR